MELRNKFIRFMTEYRTIFEQVWASGIFTNEFGNFVRRDIAQEIGAIASSVNAVYSPKGSVGQTKWTPVPWIAVFDTRITRKATEKEYIVYLLNSETRELYLTFNQAAEGKNNQAVRMQLYEKAAHIRSKLTLPPKVSLDPIVSGNSAYDAGCICSVKYTLDTLPSNNELIQDLQLFLDIYRQYFERFYNSATSNNWWPSSEEYDPGISTERWTELLNTPDVLGDSIRRMFAAMYAQGGAATCAQLAELYGKTANHYIMTAVHAAENVVKATNCPLMQDQENSKLWPVFFVGRNEPKTDRYIWKIRVELYDALTEYGIAKYLEEETAQGGEKEMTIKEKVAAIKSYIATRGFNYEGDLIENFFLSLKSKPFVILAGTSGTGKTRLVKLFAEAIGAKMKLVPVRPDWSDSSDLFGHTDLSNQFHPGAIIDFIKQAEWDKSTPHFLCLDEMNLARVEYYLSDFLSILETRDHTENGAIETDALVDASYFQSLSAKEKYGRVYIPENLYIIGTVNMDETTFPFSKKVLDRANTIEFSFVNLMARATAGGQAVAQKLDNNFLKTEYLYLQDCDDEDLIDTICFNLEELNQILVKANLHVGYRVRDEISFYMMNNKKTELLDEDAAFDHEIMQKILPRVQGSSAAIKDVLSELFIKCAGDYTGFAGAAAYEQMNAYLDSKSCKYPNSAKKIAFMMRRYEEDGFTSYWL